MKFHSSILAPRYAKSHSVFGIAENLAGSYSEKQMWKVTVDRPKQPFGPDLVSSMAKQAGVSKRDFYAAITKK